MNNKTKKKTKIIENNEFGRIMNQEEDENLIDRRQTKIKKKKKKIKEKKNEEKKENKKRVKFGKIDIIDVECWKKNNLELKAEENMEELYKITEGKENKELKNIGCVCIII